MKILQKSILPLLLIFIVFIIYTLYFAGGGDLGSFDDFDPNNNAVKEIRVQLIADRGITRQGEDVVFYAADKNGKVMLVNGHVTLPEGFDKAKVIVLKGHLSGSSFHTHEVLLD